MSKVMKILFLNPKINAKHDIARSLQKQGIAVLFPANGAEALELFAVHGNTIDLAIIHREGSVPGSSDGLSFIEKIKANPAYKNLPVILTTEFWKDSDCVTHQNGPFGANAYLHYPFTEKALADTCEGVLGRPLSTQPKVDPLAPILMDVGDIFQKPADSEISPDLSIQLEGFGLEMPAEAKAEEVPLPPLAAIGNEGPPDTRSGISIATSPVGPSLEPLSELPPLTFEAAPIPLSLPDPAPTSEPELLPQLETLEPLLSSSRDDVTGEVLTPSDAAAIDEMPYLSPGYNRKTHRVADPAFVFSEALGDAVVPGGATQAPDLETLKKYLMLREQDVAVLSNQLKVAREQVTASEKLVKEERAKQSDLDFRCSEQEKQIDDFKKEKNLIEEKFRSEVEGLNFKLNEEADRSRRLEVRLKDSVEEMEQLKARVRIDIRKIRVREKELENRLEMSKKDSEALLIARETKIIDLKRRLDILEFNLDLIQDQYSKEKENSLKLRERLTKAAQVVRAAGGLLDSNQKENDDTSKAA